VVAAIPGLIDYATTVPAGRPRQTATAHLLSNVSALACFAAAARGRRAGTVPGGGVVALGLLGTALLGIGGWLGGSLSYHHQIGVDPEEHPRRQLSDRVAATGRDHLTATTSSVASS
jgi:uncharacterized membrane protein